MGSYLVQIACSTSAGVCEAVLASSSDIITHTDLKKCVDSRILTRTGHSGGVLDQT